MVQKYGQKFINILINQRSYKTEVSIISTDTTSREVDNGFLVQTNLSQISFRLLYQHPFGGLICKPKAHT